MQPREFEIKDRQYGQYRNITLSTMQHGICINYNKTQWSLSDRISSFITENLQLLMRRVAASWSLRRALLVKFNLFERMKAELEVYDDQSSGAFPGWQVVV